MSTSDLPLSSAPPAAPEAPVCLQLNGEHVVTWLCTPHELDALAAGWLLAEGLIDSLRSVRLEVDEASRCVRATGGGVEGRGSSPRRRALASGSDGCGFSLEEIGRSEPRALTVLANLEEKGRLRGLFQEMFAGCPLRADVGGMHSGALVVEDRLCHIVEDVGRHNVVDKVIGRALLDDTPLDGALLLISGRISADMAIKGWRAGIAAMATLSIPTSLARDISRRAGVTLIGRALKPQPLRYLPDESEVRSVG